VEERRVTELRVNWRVLIECRDCGSQFEGCETDASVDVIPGVRFDHRILMVSAPNACPKCRNIRLVGNPETANGGTGRGRPRDSSADSAKLSFADDTSEKTGRSARVIREEVQLARDLDEETKDLVRGTALEDRKTDLLDLAREPEPERRRELAQKVLNGDAKSVRGAKGSAPSSLVVQAFKLVERMTASERLDFDRQIRPLIDAAEKGDSQ
jgi:hypothetical protein